MTTQPEWVWLDSVRRGFRLFSRQPVPFVLATLIYGMAASALSGAFRYAVGNLGAFFSFVLAGPCLGGLALMVREAQEDRPVDLNTAFAPWQRTGDYIVVGLAITAGVLVLFVGVLVTYTLFMFAPILLAEGHGYAGALASSRRLVLRHWRFTLPLAAAVLIGSALGSAIEFSLGLVVVVPVAVAANCVLLDHLRNLATMADSSGEAVGASHARAPREPEGG
ncbi:MAG: hypothetical protein OXU20_16750 [Myxococcales bacterium]|nr:hypothetical protein [Myxococcales bacterium]